MTEEELVEDIMSEDEKDQDNFMDVMDALIEGQVLARLSYKNKAERDDAIDRFGGAILIIEDKLKGLR